MTTVDKQTDHPGDSFPRPDPTRLTTEQLNASIAQLKELIDARLSASDKAILLLQAIFDRVPFLVDEKITALKDLHEVKFESIQNQFKERDVRTEQSSKDSKVAVDAALQAAKEAVGEQNKSSALAIAKSEASTTKQIDQLGTQVTLQSKGFDDKFTDVKDRLTRIEGHGSGIKDSWGWLVALVSMGVALFVALHKG